MCVFRDAFWLQACSQKGQEYGFSPVCIIMCLFISLCFFIVLSQKEHLYCPVPSIMGSFCKEVDKKFYLRNEIFGKEILSTIFQAFLYLISSMSILDMSVHRTLSYTSKVTIDTRNGFFSCMYHDMSFHISLILHNLIAKRTPILSCSNPNWFNLQNKQTKK